MLWGRSVLILGMLWEGGLKGRPIGGLSSRIPRFRLDWRRLHVATLSACDPWSSVQQQMHRRNKSIIGTAPYSKSWLRGISVVWHLWEASLKHIKPFPARA